MITKSMYHPISLALGIALVASFLGSPCASEATVDSLGIRLLLWNITGCEAVKQLNYLILDPIPPFSEMYVHLFMPLTVVQQVYSLYGYLLSCLHTVAMWSVSSSR